MLYMYQYTGETSVIPVRGKSWISPIVVTINKKYLIKQPDTMLMPKLICCLLVESVRQVPMAELLMMVRLYNSSTIA